MMDCQKINFSPSAARDRQAKAESALGRSVVTKIVGLALYWLGGRRRQVATAIGVPENSLRTTVRVVLGDGVAGLEDRRRSHSEGAFLPPPPRPVEQMAAVAREGDVIAVRLPAMETPLRIPAQNRLQARVVLLSLVHSGLVSAAVAAEALGLSAAHVRNLSRRLARGDVEELLDKRRGRRQEHVLTPEVKSEIVLQCAANAVAGKSAASQSVVLDLEERCGLRLSDRTLRYCVAKLGLARVTKQLPGLVEHIKRGSTA